MPFYHQLGQVPHKRHTAFRKPTGGIYYEELVGNKGFVGLQSLVYHVNRPTSIRAVRNLRAAMIEVETDRDVRMRHFFAARLPAGGTQSLDRVPVLFNSDVTIGFAQPTKSDESFYRNSQADEVLYVSDGEGTLESTFGDLPYRRGDYLVIPRGITYRLVLKPNTPHRLLTVEARGHVRTPKRYRNEFGQLLEHAPFCERDFRRPEKLVTKNEPGEFKIVMKQNDQFTELVLDHHPFDVIGWDGYYYPFAFNIGDFEPITGRVHQPPPVHQTFDCEGFVLCSFVPRMYDYHPEAVPAPYHHTNVMSDEVLYYAKDKFMSRKGIEYGSITLHPDGLTHGPHPGKAEESIGKKETDELAVMIDTFRPLKVAKAALGVEDKEYYRSWLTNP